MKRFTAFLVGACLTATITSAANQATSVNMVGFVNQNLLSNKLHFAAIQMPVVGSSNQVFSSVLGDQLPGLSWVYFWHWAGCCCVRSWAACVP